MRPVVRTVTIDAPPRTVWEALVDVETWPAWATYLRELRRQDGGPLGLGSRVTVSPKGMPAAVWTVSAYDPPRSYCWATRLAPGLVLVGDHVVEPRGDGASATLSLAAGGPLGALLSPLLRPVFRRNTRLATEGLRRYCEARP